MKLKTKKSLTTLFYSDLKKKIIIILYILQGRQEIIRYIKLYKKSISGIILS